MYFVVLGHSGLLNGVQWNVREYFWISAAKMCIIATTTCFNGMHWIILLLLTKAEAGNGKFSWFFYEAKNHFKRWHTKSLTLFYMIQSQSAFFCEICEGAECEKSFLCFSISLSRQIEKYLGKILMVRRKHCSNLTVVTHC